MASPFPTLVQPDFQPTWALIKKPSGYPDHPEVGKIEMIWDTNSKSLYRRLSPYADYNSTIFGGFTKEPFYWIYPDEAGKDLSGLKMAEAKYDSRLFPLGSGPIDVIRVSKFLASGRGIPFLAKQFLLQTGNAYNETRIYNPTSAIIAAGMGLALGAIRPMRFVDLYGGLGGIATSLLGSTIGGAIGGGTVQPPPGTVSGALPNVNQGTDSKGLLRAGTANAGLVRLEKAWPQDSTMGGGLAKTFGSILGKAAKSLFANFIPSNQSGVKVRSDEGTYGLMIGAGSKFRYSGKQGETIEVGQRWVGGAGVMRKMGQYPTNAQRFFTAPNGGYWWMTNQQIRSLSPFDRDVGAIGYPIEESRTQPGYRYGDNIGASRDSQFAASDMMVQFGYYATRGHAYDYPTKQSDPKTAEAYNAELQKVIDGISKVGNGNLYQVVLPTNSKVLTSPKRSEDGYNWLFLATNGMDRARRISPNTYLHGVLSNYRGSSIQTVDETLNFGTNQTFKLPTNGTFDAINTLEVMDKTRKITGGRLKSWPTWEPYKDDLIALFFYDVVNEKYIPFRAAFKGLTETGNASWEELPFIGRADKVYNYGGFNRNASFTLHIVISSVAELAPTWQRINYISTAIKPGNYTVANLTLNNNVSYNRFMVPPMFMLTIGDLYKDQPILIQSITITVPDDAAWETLNEYNMGNQLDWNYLARIIKAPNVKVGQLPREVELTFNLIMLEKERAIVGGANFGHAPRNDDWTQWEGGDGWNVDTVPNPGEPNKIHQNFVVNVIDTAPPPKPPPPPLPEIHQYEPETTAPELPEIHQYEPETPPPQFQVPISNVKTNNVAPPMATPGSNLSAPTPASSQFARNLTP